VRPHLTYGTVEVRICDAQATAQESEALTALIVACVAQAARETDEGVPYPDPAPRLIEENMWRAIRFGLEGELIDLQRAELYPARAAIENLLQWTAPMRSELGLTVELPSLNGAQRQRALLAQGMALHEAYGATVEATRATYAGTAPSTVEVN
jgi:carboxylate-amine ligase